MLHRDEKVPSCKLPADDPASSNILPKKSERTTHLKNEETVADANTVSMTTRAAQFGQKKGTMALPVKKVIVQDGSGRPIMINCLEDTGRQVTLITNRLVDSLWIAKSKGQLILSGLGSQRIKLHDEVLVHVRPECSEMSFPVRAHAIPKISNHLPAFDVDEVKKWYPHLRDVEVKLDKESIDLLIGQDSQVLLRQVEARYGNPNELCAVRTVFGWSMHLWSNRLK